MFYLGTRSHFSTTVSAHSCWGIVMQIRRSLNIIMTISMIIFYYHCHHLVIFMICVTVLICIILITIIYWIAVNIAIKKY
jgi:hypothetical protein